MVHNSFNIFILSLLNNDFCNRIMINNDIKERLELPGVLRLKLAAGKQNSPFDSSVGLLLLGHFKS